MNTNPNNVRMATAVTSTSVASHSAHAMPKRSPQTQRNLERVLGHTVEDDQVVSDKIPLDVLGEIREMIGQHRASVVGLQAVQKRLGEIEARIAALESGAKSPAPAGLVSASSAQIANRLDSDKVATAKAITNDLRDQRKQRSVVAAPPPKAPAPAREDDEDDDIPPPRK
jgi:hypothetical protein